MKIAIFDHLITDKNAIGKCHLQLLDRLVDEHDFTVFAVEFDNPHPDRIRFIKVPALRRPLLGLMISFHIIAPLMLWWYRLIEGEKFDLVQGIGGNFLNADLAYGHFCHRVYLREHGDARPKEWVRRIYSLIYDSIVSALEPMSYGRAKYIVTPSEGLKQELKEQFPRIASSDMSVISNPIDIQKLYKPTDLDLSTMRETLNITSDDLVMVFVAAGHFERKGLPVLLDAMQLVEDSRVKLIVVGGNQMMIDQYSTVAEKQGLLNQIQFVGFRDDIRQYLWVADIFAFPSSYETFSLVSFEAAAAELPLLVSPLYGVEELLKNNHNGWEVERTPMAFAEKIRFALGNREQLRNMGRNAVASVQDYSADTFTSRWKALYEHVAQQAT